MDSNWIHGPSGQNGGVAPIMVLEISTVLMTVEDPDFSWTSDWCHWKGYLLAFCAYVECPKQRSYAIWTSI
jgi:hypothetical protein